MGNKIFPRMQENSSLCSSIKKLERRSVGKEGRNFHKIFSQSVSNVVWQMGNQGPKLVIMTLTVRHTHTGKFRHHHHTIIMILGLFSPRFCVCLSRESTGIKCQANEPDFRSCC